MYASGCKWPVRRSQAAEWGGVLALGANVGGRVRLWKAGENVLATLQELKSSDPLVMYAVEIVREARDFLAKAGDTSLLGKPSSQHMRTYLM